ncbi:cell wall-binding repeat-containing protein [Kineococcus rhizosphaerae]|uniref:Putative cell wall binding repeat protein n=1 Tax=Kineococcus rhizosphaerae TaxID=559628 RepID=A0A2T0R109_9ACTN|nr:cell wall-binding repeat-containing protein [Kineococcus rhizosphaerae]PRY12993.1 putative cell wall binding repeat protein [Kineococcus rhizosphaerae]
MRLTRRSTLPALAAATLLVGFTGSAAQAATPVPKVGTPFPYVGLVRAAGADRYETAAVISQGSFQPSAGSSVFVTSGEAPADALTAGPAAASLDAPLLLTRAGDLPAPTAAELARLKPTTVYVVGGTDRVSDATLTAIGAAAPGSTVERIAGADRYATAVAVADAFFPNPEGVVLTRGDTFPDALSGGAAAASSGVPVMITEPGQLPAPVASWMAAHTFAASLVVGGPDSVSPDVATALAARTTGSAPTRIAGADRYDTSSAVAAKVFPKATTVVLATGDNFPDALAGVPAAAVNAAPILLLPQTCFPASTFDYLSTFTEGVSEIILGGPTAVTPEALSVDC